MPVIDLSLSNLREYALNQASEAQILETLPYLGLDIVYFWGHRQRGIQPKQTRLLQRSGNCKVARGVTRRSHRVARVHVCEERPRNRCSQRGRYTQSKAIHFWYLVRNQCR